MVVNILHVSHVMVDQLAALLDRYLQGLQIVLLIELLLQHAVCDQAGFGQQHHAVDPGPRHIDRGLLPHHQFLKRRAFGVRLKVVLNPKGFLGEREEAKLVAQTCVDKRDVESEAVETDHQCLIGRNNDIHNKEILSWTDRNQKLHQLARVVLFDEGILAEKLPLHQQSDFLDVAHQRLMLLLVGETHLLEAQRLEHYHNVRSDRSVRRLVSLRAGKRDQLLCVVGSSRRDVRAVVVESSAFWIPVAQQVDQIVAAEAVLFLCFDLPAQLELVQKPQALERGWLREETQQRVVYNFKELAPLEKQTGIFDILDKPIVGLLGGVQQLLFELGKVCCREVIELHSMTHLLRPFHEPCEVSPVDIAVELSKRNRLAVGDVWFRTYRVFHE